MSAADPLWFHLLGGDGQSFYDYNSSWVSNSTIVVAVVIFYRKHTCHAKGCWRISKHAVEGTPWIVCRKHHPTASNSAPTVDQIHADHRVATIAGR